MENDTSSETSAVDSNALKSDNPPPVESGAGEKVRTLSESSADTSRQVDRQNSSASTSSDTKRVGDKINILLKPVGDAPILKQKLWAVPSERLVSQITEFVKKYLKLDKNQNLFVFVNQLFAPAPDQCIRDLYECFGSDNKLVLHYSTTVAWG